MNFGAAFGGSIGAGIGSFVSTFLSKDPFGTTIGGTVGGMIGGALGGYVVDGVDAAILGAIGAACGAAAGAAWGTDADFRLGFTTRLETNSWTGVHLTSTFSAGCGALWSDCPANLYSVDSGSGIILLAFTHKDRRPQPTTSSLDHNVFQIQTSTYHYSSDIHQLPTRPPPQGRRGYCLYKKLMEFV